MRKTIFLSTVLALTLLIMPTENVSASYYSQSQITQVETSDVKAIPVIVDKINEKQVDHKLQSIGFPKEELEVMPFDQKQHLVNQGVIKYITKETKEYYYDGNGTLVEKDSDGDITIEGTIPTTDLSLTITTSQLTTQSDGKKRFTVTNNWNWSSSVGLNGDTYYNLTDKLALSYSSDFEADPYTNGGYTCSHYGQHFFSGNSYWLSDCGGRTSELSYGGVGWNVDIQGDYRDYGWASMNVIAKKSNTNWTNSTSFLGKYGHDTSFSGAIGLTIGPLSLSLSSGSSWDEAAVSKVIWY